MNRDADTSSTILRACAPALGEILGHAFPVLDHGFVRVVDYMGDDTAIVQAARVSYGKGTKQVSNDAGLIRYLMRHWHSTPFEMCEIKFHVKLPIFVARQWMRHRTGSFNEVSGRYSILPDEMYVPEMERMQTQSASNKQGSSTEIIDGAEQARLAIFNSNSYLHGFYEGLIDGGLSRELARCVLPVSQYTEFYWTVNLHNLMHFLRLRADSHAQYEIRVYADVIEQIVAKWVPLAYQAYLDYRKNAVSVSAMGKDCLMRRLAGEKVTQANSGMSASEWREFVNEWGDV